MSTITSGTHSAPASQRGEGRPIDLSRISARFGVAFAVCQLALLTVFAIAILPKGGQPGDPVLERGAKILEARDLYAVGNYGLALSGMLLLGFLGVVGQRLRRADSTGVLASVAVAGGTLLAVIWPLAAVIHNVFLDIADTGADVRILAGVDSIAPYCLALSAFPRIFFIGAIVLGLRATGSSPMLRRTGVAIAGLSLIGTATMAAGELFPALALSSLCFEIWVGVLAWRWLRDAR